MVKFSTTYCIELHEYCYYKGHAPKIYGYDVLPGGRHAIAMEYNEHAHAYNNTTLESQIAVRQLVDGFQAQGTMETCET